MDFTNNSRTLYRPSSSWQGWYDYLYRPSYAHAHQGWLADYLNTPKSFPSALDEQPKDLVDRMLFDRRHTLTDRISSIQGRLRSRWHVFRQNMYSLNLQECIVCTTMDNLADQHPYQIVRRRQGLEQEMHQIKKERRGESTALWDDVSKLEAELVEALGEYRQLALNEQLLTGGGNGDG